MDITKAKQFLKGRWLTEDYNHNITFHNVSMTEWNPFAIGKNGQRAKQYEYALSGSYPDYTIRYRDESGEMQMPLRIRGIQIELPIDGQVLTFRQRW